MLASTLKDTPADICESLRLMTYRFTDPASSTPRARSTEAKPGKSWMDSKPTKLTMLSSRERTLTVPNPADDLLCASRIRRSFPRPPIRESAAASSMPALMVSLPAPKSTRSTPEPNRTKSSPAPESIVSLPAPAVMVSPPLPVTMFSEPSPSITLRPPS